MLEIQRTEYIQLRYKVIAWDIGNDKFQFYEPNYNRIKSLKAVADYGSSFFKKQDLLPTPYLFYHRNNNQNLFP